MYASLKAQICTEIICTEIILHNTPTSFLFVFNTMFALSIQNGKTENCEIKFFQFPHCLCCLSLGFNIGTVLNISEF